MHRQHHHHHHKHAPTARSEPTDSTAPTPTGVSSSDNARNPRPVAADDIRLRAYRKWEGAGKPAGDGVRFWLEAEQELTQGK